MSPSSKNLMFPRLLPPSERTDMWEEHVMRKYPEEENPPPKPPARTPLTWDEMEEISDRAMLEGLQAGIEELFFENTAPAVTARVVLGRSPRPRLVATNAAAVRSRGDRFRGRYRPHLVGENTDNAA